MATEKNDSIHSPEKIEVHPLPPFLPPNAKVLMSGSFPPPRTRWCMEWFYPNYINDMWRIFGYLATGDKDYFVDTAAKKFRKEKLIDYFLRKGVGFSDTGENAVRLRNNASDKFLEIVKPRDFNFLLSQMPECRHILLTGEKAMDTLGAIAGFKTIPVGEYVETDYFLGRKVKVWRMPSSSRAFPRPVEWKAEYYRRPFDDAGIDLSI